MSLAAAAAAAAIQGISTWYGRPVISNKDVRRTVKQSKNLIRTSTPHMFGNMSQFEEYTEQSIKPHRYIGQRPDFTPPLLPDLPLPSWEQIKKGFYDVIREIDPDALPRPHMPHQTAVNGTMIWRISGVSQYIKSAKKGELESIYSPPLFTPMRKDTNSPCGSIQTVILMEEEPTFLFLLPLCREIMTTCWNGRWKNISPSGCWISPPHRADAKTINDHSIQTPPEAIPIKSRQPL